MVNSHNKSSNILFILCLCIASAVAQTPVLISNAARFIAQQNEITLNLSGNYLYNITEIEVGDSFICQPSDPLYSISITPCLIQSDRINLCPKIAKLASATQPSSTSLCDTGNYPNCLNIQNSPAFASCTPETHPYQICKFLSCNFFYPLQQQYNCVQDALNLTGYSCGTNAYCNSNATCVTALAPKCNSSITCTVTNPPYGVLNVSVTNNQSLSSTLVDAITVLPYPLVDTILGQQTGGFAAPIVVSQNQILNDTTFSTVYRFFGVGNGNYSNDAVFNEANQWPVTDIWFEFENVTWGIDEPVPFIYCGTYPCIAALAVSLTYVGSGGLQTSYTDQSAVLAYYPLPVVNSGCPWQIYSFVNNSIKITGVYFITDEMQCFADGESVHAHFEDENNVVCDVMSNKTENENVVLTLSNANSVQSTTVVSIQVLGSCEIIKPNSVPLAGSCQCTPGHEDLDRVCLPCQDGFWQSQYGQESCIPCSSNENTDGNTGSLSVSSCVCKDGYFRASPQDACLSCSPMLDCSNSSDVVVRKGNWIDKNNALGTVASCGNYGGCRGGAGTGDSLCATGYRGAYCRLCESGYAAINSNKQCAKCQSTATNIAVVFLAFLFVICMLVYLLSFSVSPLPKTPGESENGNYNNTDAKIIVNYFQILYYVVQAIDIGNGGATEFSIFKITIPFSVSLSFPQFQCLTRVNFYQLMILYMLLPLILNSVVALIFAAVARFLPEKYHAYVFKPTLKNFVAATTIVFYILYPMVITQLLASLHCIKLPHVADHRVATFVSIRCNSQTYHVYKTVCLLYIVVLGIAGWMYVGRALYKIESNEINYLSNGIDSEATPYSYLISGYKTEYYMWEGVVLARKIFVATVAALLQPSLQIVWMLVCLFISLIVTLLAHPFQSIIDNRMEIFAHAALIASLVIGYHEIVLGIGVQSDIMALVLVVNLLLWVYLAYMLRSRLRDRLQSASKSLVTIFKFNDNGTANVIMYDRQNSSNNRRNGSSSSSASASSSTYNIKSFELEVLPT